MFIFTLFTVLMLSYWVLWLLGVRLPGVSNRAFRGWLYSESEESARKRP